ncbi:MAG: DUF6516 family protein [Syntrophales bacterium]|jgi:hypothetical protein|nr:DUF6516 family protein [Syntrophales bacterium]
MGATPLLNLDGLTEFIEGGSYWVKFEVWKVDPTEHIPNGIRYSLTLHDRSNTRILGFDNAHSYHSKKRRYKAQKITWDHTHKSNKIFPYEFDSASQLIEDFWKEVYKLIK